MQLSANCAVTLLKVCIGTITLDASVEKFLWTVAASIGELEPEIWKISSV
jgi:hypothetical protein